MLFSTMIQSTYSPLRLSLPTPKVHKTKARKQRGGPQVCAASLDPQYLYCSMEESGTGAAGDLSPASDSDLGIKGQTLTAGLLF